MNARLLDAGSMRSTWADRETCKHLRRFSFSGRKEGGGGGGSVVELDCYTRLYLTRVTRFNRLFQFIIDSCFFAAVPARNSLSMLPSLMHFRLHNSEPGSRRWSRGTTSSPSNQGLLSNVIPLTWYIRCTYPIMRGLCYL